MGNLIHKLPSPQIILMGFVNFLLTIAMCFGIPDHCGLDIPNEGPDLTYLDLDIWKLHCSPSSLHHL